LSALLGQFGSVDLPNVAAGLVILAGDIDRGIKGVVWARQAFPGIPVLYVAGNHEHFSISEAAAATRACRSDSSEKAHRNGWALLFPSRLGRRPMNSRQRNR
jgi:hypothetical protein